MTASSAARARPLRPTASAVVVRRATRADLARTAAWQVDHLGSGFFPSLGPRFVERWHATHLHTRAGVALLAELDAGPQGQVPVGFLVGSTDQVAHVRAVLQRYRTGLALAAGLALARRPRTAVRFVRTRARPYARRLLARRSVAAPAGGPAAGPVAVVAAVVVAPAARGAGVGEALLTAFADAARRAGTEVAELVTRTDGGAGAFYERLGWERVLERADRDGGVVRTYRSTLTPSADGASAPSSPASAPTGGTTPPPTGPAPTPWPQPRTAA